MELMNKESNSIIKNNSDSVGNLSNLFDKTYFRNINLIYYIDYFTYKKELIKNIYNNINLIINFFNEEICDILIKIKILNKKKKITDDEFKIFESIYNLVELLEQITFFDQEDFLNILLSFFEIKVFAEKMNIFFNKFKFRDLVDIKILTNGINNLYDKISENNLFLKTLLIIIYTSSEIKNISGEIKNISGEIKNISGEIKNISGEIKKLAKEIAFDFFMYYNSLNLYEKIIKFLIDLSKKINIVSNFISGIEKIKFYKNFKNNKIIFLEEYDLNFNKHLEIYSNFEYELKIKFKLKNKLNIKKFINDLKYISNVN